jgi:hypothetical protein
MYRETQSIQAARLDGERVRACFRAVAVRFRLALIVFWLNFLGESADA